MESESLVCFCSFSGRVIPYERPQLNGRERESPVVIGPRAFSVLFPESLLFEDEDEENPPQIDPVEDRVFAQSDPFFEGGSSCRIREHRVARTCYVRGLPYWRMGVGRYIGPSSEEAFRTERDWAVSEWRRRGN